MRWLGPAGAALLIVYPFILTGPFYERMGADLLEREASAVALATPDMVIELRRLLELVRLPEGLVDKWLAKANVDTFEDMPEEAIGKCIAYLNDRISERRVENVPA